MITIEYPTRQGVQRRTLDEPVRIGRAPENEVWIPLPFVSRHHAVIERRNGACRLRQLSPDGSTVIGGRAVGIEAELRPGDVVYLGGRFPVKIVSVAGDGVIDDKATDPSLPPGTKTRQLQVRPDDRVVTFGRDPSNTVRLESPQVSRFHAHAERTTRGWQLTDLSTNGTFVNGAAVKQAVIGPHDLIVIGPYNLRMGGLTVGVGEDESIRVEAFDLTRVVRAGGRELTILDGVSLVVEPGEFLAVVGGSGAGKSTLLKALTGIEPATTGDVLINGVSLNHNLDAMRGRFGYVPQDHILHMELPLGEALDFAAELRMPPDTSPAERARRVHDCLAQVGLAEKRDTIVERLSGGEKKRASIAMELLTQPRLLFLDEPTSALDPKFKKEVMDCLQRLARAGHTVVMISHDTNRLTDMCDKVAFLAPGGRLAYTGPSNQALPYFRQTSDRLCRSQPAYDTALKNAHVQAQQFDDIYMLIDPPNWPAAQMQPLATYWKQAFLNNPLYAREISERQRHRPDRALTPPPVARNTAQERADAWRQFTILSRRYLSVLRHDTRNLVMLALTAPVLAMLLRVLYNHEYFVLPVRGSNANASQAMQFAFALAFMAVFLGTMNAIREIAKEDAIYRRERLINLKVAPYLGSKLAVLVGVAAAQLALLVLIVALLIRPSGGPGGLIGSFVVLLLAAAGATAAALAVSASAANENRAMVLAPLLIIPQFLFAGAFKPIKELPTPAQLIPALTIDRWAFEGVSRMIDVRGLVGDTRYFANLDAVSGNPAFQVFMLLVLFGAFSALAYYLQARKG
jgi:ABC-type multidrug transport system ATPase subunit/pSer/pThr/pTyr-binding forkhead associated (FHA) protein/ABC-type multidrug transport system permease subunit